MSFHLAPPQASTFAPEIDTITLSLLGISVAIMILVAGLILYFGIRYRKGSPHSRVLDRRGQSLLEWGWTFASFFIFIALCGWAAYVFFQMHTPPAGATEIAVVGKQWMWKFQHADGRRELNELHVPVGTPILLSMISQDVIHSLFVPAFRIKQDVLPGRYTRTYHLFCTQYCGTMHAEMRGTITVLSHADYQRWLSSGLSAEPRYEELAARGYKLFSQLGCVHCHGAGASVHAPPLEHLYGSQVPLSDGRHVFADEDYLRESIVNPRAKIVEGYQPLMPPFSKQASEEDLLALIAYLKSLTSAPNGDYSD
jgi:cytochrome c oxidase subunit 2